MGPLLLVVLRQQNVLLHQHLLFTWWNFLWSSNFHNLICFPPWRHKYYWGKNTAKTWFTSVLTVITLPRFVCTAQTKILFNSQQQQLVNFCLDYQITQNKQRATTIYNPRQEYLWHPVWPQEDSKLYHYQIP